MNRSRMMGRKQTARKMIGCIAAGLLLCGAGTLTSAGTEVPPYPGYYRLLAPKTDKPIIIDGRIDKDEWRSAALVCGLIRGQTRDELLPEEQQTWFYVTYDDNNLYIAMRSKNFPVGSGKKLKTDLKDEKDVASVGLYDHFEIQFSRNSDAAAAVMQHFYKFLGNHRGAICDMKAQPAVGQQGFEWEGGATVQNRVTDEYWDMEIAIPFKNMIESFAPEDWETWLMWLVRAYTCAGNDFFMWGGEHWLAWIRMPQLTFHSNLVTARLEQLGEPLAGKLDARFSLINHTDSPQIVRVNATVEDQGKGIYRFDMTNTLPPGASQNVPIQKMDLPVATNKTTLLTMTVWMDERPTEPGVRPPKKKTTSEPVVLYQQQVLLVPKDEAYVRLHFAPVKRSREQTLDYTWKAAYYHSTGTIRGHLNLDIGGLDDKYRQTARWQLRVVDADSGAAGFESFADVKALQAEVVDTIKPRLHDGDWRMESRLINNKGKTIDTRTYPMTIQTPAWEQYQGGLDDAYVPPPYTPVKAEGQKLKVLNREFILDEAGLPASLINENHEMIKCPLRFETCIDGKPVIAAGKGMAWKDKEPGKVTWTGKAEAAGLSLWMTNSLEYDGSLFVNLTLDPGAQPVRLDSLRFTMDMGAWVNVCKTYRGSSYAGNVDFWITTNHQGVFWESARTRPIKGVTGSFNPYIYLGTPNRGVWWFSDSDRGWMLDDARSATTVERLQDGTIRMNQWLVNAPSTITAPRTIRFMIQPAPPKPLPKNWREISWGPDRIYGGSDWADGYFSFSYNTADEWKQFPKWGWASLPLYVANGFIGQAVPGFSTYAGEWMGDSDFDKLPVDPAIAAWYSNNVYVNAAGLQYTNNFNRRVGGFVEVDNVPSMVNCRVYYYDQGVQFGGLRGFWWDMWTMWPMFKPELGFGYIRPDGRQQAEFNFFANREMLKRMYQIAWQHQVEPEHWHYADGPWSSFLYGVWLIEGDICSFYMFDKNVDLISNAPRVSWPMATGRFLGCVPKLKSNFGQLDPFGNPRPTRAALTLCLLNDCGGNGINDYVADPIRELLKKEGYFASEVKCWKHWEPELTQSARFIADEHKADVAVTLYALTPQKLLFVLGNLSETGTTGTLVFKPRPLLGNEMNCMQFKVRDLESSVIPHSSTVKGVRSPEELNIQNIWVGGHDFRLLALEP